MRGRYLLLPIHLHSMLLATETEIQHFQTEQACSVKLQGIQLFWWGAKVHLTAQISGCRSHGNYEYKTRINTYDSPVEYLPGTKYFSHMLYLVTNINT